MIHGESPGLRVRRVIHRESLRDRSVVAPEAVSYPRRRAGWAVVAVECRTMCADSA